MVFIRLRMSPQLSLFLGVFCLTAHVAISVDSECDKTKCRGPLMHYKALGCKAIYRKSDNCCPYKYDCDHLESRAADKCYVNNREYNIGELLIEEDRNPCDFGCICVMRNDVAEFACAPYSCPYPDIDSNCYFRQNSTNCCPEFEAICPKSAVDRPTCEVNSKTYLDGEYFSVEGKECYCGPNFSGDFVEPFCRTPKQGLCTLDVHYGYNVKKNCPPVFYSGQDPQTGCGVDFRCANARDAVIKQGKNGDLEEKKSNDGDEDKEELDLKCHFGNLTLRIGDSLKPATDHDSVCVECQCELPPLVTCTRKNYDECDPSKHEDFSKYRDLP